MNVGLRVVYLDIIIIECGFFRLKLIMVGAFSESKLELLFNCFAVKCVRKVHGNKKKTQ